MKKRKYKYTLIFFLYADNTGDALEKVDCDHYAEYSDEMSPPKIFCLFDNKDIAIGYPAESLRKVIQNFGVEKITMPKIADESKKEVMYV